MSEVGAFLNFYKEYLKPKLIKLTCCTDAVYVCETHRHLKESQHRLDGPIL